MRRIFLAVVLFALSAAALDQPVRTQAGLVSGTAGKSPEVRVYKGIPYAAPPVGDLRWKAPRPVAGWQDVRQVSEFGPTCMQSPYAATSPYRSNLGQVSEDCLYLNVWTAAKSARERLPVMVWIHGGAFTRGSGSTPTYDGEAFAKKGVVLVTVNYRLGVFGFFAHPELTAESEHHSSGNYGMLDQIAALEWVQKNIAAFGGDPKRVTIFGESAGSFAVNTLMATPLAKGLFHRVIGESGAMFSLMAALAEAEKSGEKFGSLKDLRAKSADDLLKAEGQWTANRPKVDGWLLPKDIYTIFADGRQNDVPVLAGSNADEGTTLSPYPPSGTAQLFQEQVKRRYPQHVEQFLKLYPAGNDEQARKSHYTAFSDAFFWQMHTWVRLASKTGRAPTWQYYFTRIPPGPLGQRLGSYHAAEIQYVFGNLNPERPWEEADRKLSETMSAYWVNFATNGNPNGKGLPEWPAYKEKNGTVLEFGNQIAARPNFHLEPVAFLDSYYQSLRTGN